jgi:replicative DNA helicase
MVIFLYRPEYYGLDQDAEGNSTQGVGEVIIAKHRNGSLETVQLKFIGKYTKFADLDGVGGGFPGDSWRLPAHGPARQQLRQRAQRRHLCP